MKDGEPFAMAGLCERWRKASSDDAFTIIVTVARGAIAEGSRPHARSAIGSGNGVDCAGVTQFRHGRA
jgi:hypothetical protein